MAWLTGWIYRKSVTLSRASGAVTNYQMKLLVGESAGAVGAAVDCGGKVLPSFDDLRFTTSDGTTLLDYWIESLTGVTPNQLATVWIEFNSIGTGATTFYMYYGNTGAPAASNGTRTFLLFDKFDYLNPVLRPTQSWESGTILYWGTIALLAGVYYIYYANGTAPTSDIGRATSTDLITWTKAAGNPIILDRVGPALLKSLDGITPITDGGNYYMTTCASNGSGIQIHQAAAIDSNTWVVGGIVIAPAVGTWYSNMVLTNSFIKSGSTFYIFFQGYDGTRWRVGYATAAAVTGPYTVQGMLLGPTEGWEGTAIVDPEIRLFGSTYYLFYTGNTGTSCRNSYATCSTLTGAYTKSGIFIGPLGHSYPAILQKDGLFWILDDNLVQGQKYLSSRENLDGGFDFPAKWTQGGTPTIESGALVINAVGEYIKSIATHGLNTALRARARFATYQNWLQVGYNNNLGAATGNQASFFAYSTPTVRSISSAAGANTITDLGNKGTAYLIWEIKRTSATPRNIYLITDAVVATHITNIVLTALSVMIENAGTAGLINVDWILVRQIFETEPAWGIWGSEEIAPLLPGTSFVAWIN